MAPEKIQEFLSGLTELSNRTGIIISGCGCHGSPYLVDARGTVDSYEEYGETDQIVAKVKGEWVVT